MIPFAKNSFGAGCLALVALFSAGCGSTQQAYDPVNPPSPYVFPGQATSTRPDIATNQVPLPVGAATNTLRPAPPPVGFSYLRIGDSVTISFSDVPATHALQPVITQIGEDGTVTLPFNVRVSAIGKTPRQLEQEIRGEYVPSLFKVLTVTVKTDQRVFYVGGEVRAPNRYPHLGDMTVLRAIQSAGDFTDFANKGKIELRRENGETRRIDYHKALRDSKLDLPVYPNDQIIVHKRIF